MDQVSFTVNGDRYIISGTDVDVNTSLNDFIRNHLQLHGTKAMCHEGGCGACIVSVSATHPVTKEKHVFSVNSCLVSVLSCHDWDIKTTEGIGNRKDGYNPIQVTLAAFNGSQCGYCTSGWVMSMYALMQSNNKLTTKQVENSFGGNMCRCTGYRPILDTFKTFATDVEPALRNRIQDLEDLHLTKCAKKCERKCSMSEDEWCVIDSKPGSLMEINSASGQWFKAYTLQDVFSVLKRKGVNSYRLVAGNTGQGVYPFESEARVFIDISAIESLKLAMTDQNLVIGAGMTLTDVMKTFKDRSKKTDEFCYLDALYKHLDLVAHVPVRNIGTIGGNLALKNLHHDFPSDIFLLLATVGATVSLVNSSQCKSELKMRQFLKTDVKGKIITEIKLPPLNCNNLIRTYKVMPRAQNAHAIVNAGFLIELTADKLIKSANVVFGNISPTFVNATETEQLLIGKKIDNKTLQMALKKLSDEIMPMDIPPEPSPKSRKLIALGLFYKAMLSLAKNVNPRYQSGGTVLSRGISHGTQIYETDKNLWPLNKPVPKLEGLAQCSGEVQYVCDVYSGPREVHLAFVLSEMCRAEVLGFDASEALQAPGVIAFYSAKDIPGKNCFTPTNAPWTTDEEEIFVSKTTAYYGQPLGVVVAINKRQALTAASLVRVKYKQLDVKPVLTVREALAAPDKDKRLQQNIKVEPKTKGTDIKYKLTGRFTVPSQYHYTMETQSCNVQIKDSSVIVRSSTQWMDMVNIAVAGALGIDENRVLIEVPRLGGGYGGKASRASLIACATAIAAYKLNRPASLVMPITDNMNAIGKRHLCEFDYECAVNRDGVIQYLNLDYYSDNGCSFNDTPGGDIAGSVTSLYNSDSFNVTGYSILTDKPCETWCRAPATTEGIAFTEHLMDRISHVTGKDHIEVRIANIRPDRDDLKDLITSFKKDTAFEDRRSAIKKFNQQNAWKKKSLKLSLMCYPIAFSWNYPVTVSIYHGDGTIAISHGGIEMGQGIHTKIAQVCAYTLKVPLEKVFLRGSDSFVSPNAMASNSSITSDCVAFGTIKACNELLKRLEPIKKDMNEPTWEELIQEAFLKGINLQASYMTSPNDGLKGYTVYGICASEVELDILTGNHMIRRLDIFEDTGVSMSPEIDVGQIEGAFVMGIGLWTSEQLKFDAETGRLLTDRTWTYKPPGALDIPEDFRIKFRPNSGNPLGVLRSKATGEPAIALAVVLTHALHDAILEGRKEFGYVDKDWLFIDAPFSVERIITSISPKIEKFLLT